MDNTTAFLVNPELVSGAILEAEGEVDVATHSGKGHTLKEVRSLS